MRREKPEPFVPCLSNANKQGRVVFFFVLFCPGRSNRVLIRCTLQCGASALVVEVSQVFEISIMEGKYVGG